MKHIIITLPEIFIGETELINRLFEEGAIPRLHLRKPESDEITIAEWIEQIAPSFRHRIVLHDHHALALKYQLGGIHLNSRNPNAPEWVHTEKRERTFTISRSCHTIAEIKEYRTRFDYLFLSPIFDSISKQGYHSGFSQSELREASLKGLFSNNVYALGGISYENLSQIERLGFDGAAMLGAFWQKYR